MHKPFEIQLELLRGFIYLYKIEEQTFHFVINQIPLKTDDLLLHNTAARIHLLGLLVEHFGLCKVKEILKEQ